MKWLDVIINYYKDRSACFCPFCGSKNLEFEEMYIGRGSLNISCPDCGQSAHVDGQIPPPETTGK